MKSVLTVLAYLSFCLGGALMTIAVLAVPHTAYADSGNLFCDDYCATQCGSDSICEANCISACTGGCDPCKYYSEPQYSQCMTWCKASESAEGCKLGECELPINDPYRCNFQLKAECEDEGKCKTTGEKCSESCKCQFTIGTTIPCWCR